MGKAALRLYKGGFKHHLVATSIQCTICEECHFPNFKPFVKLHDCAQVKTDIRACSPLTMPSKRFSKEKSGGLEKTSKKKRLVIVPYLPT